MVKIVTDSSTLYTREEAKAAGFEATPLCVSIDDWNGRDLEMDIDQFYKMIEEGHVPQSSQPPIGEVVDLYESSDEEMINITMADGLSGTYNSACSAKDMVENNERITVVNSHSLCGPHRYMVEKAAEMARAGKEKLEILAWLKDASNKTESFLMPRDFSFLRRGGRLTPVASTISTVLKLKPILTGNEGCTRLDKFSVKRTFTSAVGAIVKHWEEKGIGEKHICYVSHANVAQEAKIACELLKQAFPKLEIRTLQLGPAFITQGGPGCVAIQYIER